MNTDTAGKGDAYRPVDKKKYDRNYERIFPTANDVKALAALDILKEGDIVLALARQGAPRLMLSIRRLTDGERLAVFDMLRQHRRYRLAVFDTLRRQYCLRCGAKRPEESCGCFNKEK